MQRGDYAISSQEKTDSEERRRLQKNEENGKDVIGVNAGEIGKNHDGGIEKPPIGLLYGSGFDTSLDPDDVGIAVPFRNEPVEMIVERVNTEKGEECENENFFRLKTFFDDFERWELE